MAISILHADIGKTILWSLFVVGPPVALVTGPFLARRVSPHVPLELAGLGATAVARPSAPRSPSFAVSLFTIMLPVLLMLVATAGSLIWKEELYPAGTWQASMRMWTAFIGNANVAMLIAVLVSFVTFGRACGLHGKQILKFSEDCLAPASGVMLVIAAGGGFSKVLNASGVGDALAALGSSMHLSPLLLGWLIAGMMRVGCRLRHRLGHHRREHHAAHRQRRSPHQQGTPRPRHGRRFARPFARERRRLLAGEGIFRQWTSRKRSRRGPSWKPASP